MAHVIHNSGNVEWYTPPHIIEAARRAMGSIDTDPATSEIANETVQAATIYTAETDGRTQPWHGNVWLNPPYSRALLPDFVDALERNLPRITQAVVLVNNATETTWFQRLLYRSDAVCLLRRRVQFLTPEGGGKRSPLQGQAVLYFGAETERFERAFAPLGAVLVPQGE